MTDLTTCDDCGNRIRWKRSNDYCRVCFNQAESEDSHTDSDDGAGEPEVSDDMVAVHQSGTVRSELACPHCGDTLLYFPGPDALACKKCGLIDVELLDEDADSVAEIDNVESRTEDFTRDVI